MPDTKKNPTRQAIRDLVDNSTLSDSLKLEALITVILTIKNTENRVTAHKDARIAELERVQGGLVEALEDLLQQTGINGWYANKARDAIAAAQKPEGGDK